jgi:hypothetical protein
MKACKSGEDGKATSAPASVSKLPCAQRRISAGKSLALALLVGSTVLASGSALGQWHHGSRVGIGINLGYPLYGPEYYPYGPYYSPYYYPPIVAVPSAPPVYVEQGQLQSAPTQAQPDWFYCAESRTYYPYTQECPGGWQRVPSQPPVR